MTTNASKISSHPLLVRPRENYLKEEHKYTKRFNSVLHSQIH